MDEEDLGEHHMPGSATQVDSTTPNTNTVTQIESIKSLCGQKGEEIITAIGRAISDRRNIKLVEKLDKYGLGYAPSRNDLEL